MAAKKGAKRGGRTLADFPALRAGVESYLEENAGVHSSAVATELDGAIAAAGGWLELYEAPIRARVLTFDDALVWGAFLLRASARVEGWDRSFPAAEAQRFAFEAYDIHVEEEFDAHLEGAEGDEPGDD